MSDSAEQLPKGDILIVDDTPDNLRLLSQMLSERHYRVRAATGGERALASARLSPPELILLDIKMPDMDGFTVCRALKADRATADIPVIFISALDDVADKVQAFAAGGVDYVTKPFQWEEVLARVETHLALRRLQQTLERANRKMGRELALAGQVQAGFLPDRLPAAPGWQWAVTLQPARETSGDFYDIFRLPNGRFALLMADVVDKGVCAALFMALTYALFRSHAAGPAPQPAQVFAAINAHIREETRTNQFVTAFYAILDPAGGELVYGNAGHCPPLWLRRDGRVRWLANTGMSLGVLAGATWREEMIRMAPGEALVLYTDGLIEAEDGAERPFGRRRLLAAAEGRMGETAVALQEGIVATVRGFVGERPLLDDLALMVVVREKGDG